MVLLAPCIACRHGYHDQHVEVVQAVPEGMLGGHRCLCKGECRSRSRDCPCCEGKGCEECGGTASAWRRMIDAGGGIRARVSGNAPLDSKTQDALSELMRVVAEQMETDDA